MASDPRIGLFPGTFDPITNGHLDVIRRGCKLFDRLIVAVGHNPDKRELFTMAERAAMITELMAEISPNVTVAMYHGLTVDYAKTIGATAIVRGLRNVSDLHHEFQLALTNRAVADIETVFIMSGEPFGFTSSSLIKQIAAGGAVDQLRQLLPPLVLEKMKQKKTLLGEDMARLHVDGHKD